MYCVFCSFTVSMAAFDLNEFVANLMLSQSEKCRKSDLFAFVTKSDPLPIDRRLLYDL